MTDAAYNALTTEPETTELCDDCGAYCDCPPAEAFDTHFDRIDTLLSKMEDRAKRTPPAPAAPTVTSRAFEGFFSDMLADLDSGLASADTLAAAAWLGMS